MRISITTASVTNTVTSLFILLVFISPVIRLAAGFIPFIVVLGVIASFVVVQLFRNYYKGHTTFFLMLLLVLMSVSTALNAHGNLEALFYAVTSLVSLLFAYWLAKQDKEKVVTLSLFVLTFFYLFFIYSGTKHGFQPNDINNYFIESSRNAVSTVALLFQILYSATYYRARNKLPKITPIITLLIAIFSYGRSGIALSALLVMISFASVFWHSKALYKLFFLFLVLALSVLLLQYIEAIKYVIFTETNFSSGLDTPRTQMIREYIARLDLSSIILGKDLSTIAIINQYNNNPHNSVIYGHSQYGVFYIVLLLGLSLIIIRRTLFRKGGIIYAALIFIFFIRILSDKISLPGVFDYIFYYIFYVIYFDNKK